MGQQTVSEHLTIALDAAKKREERLDHVLLSGPPGLGKTTLAHIIALEMGSAVHTVAGPHIEKKADLAALLANLAPRDVLFIDEIHRMPRAIEEILYSAMEDSALCILAGQGMHARTLRIDLAPFTLIGATTRVGLLSAPLRDRFGMHFRLELYADDDLAQIVQRSAHLLALQLTDAAARALAMRARGTPRLANRLLHRIRDYITVRKSHIICLDQVDIEEALDFLRVDVCGLDRMDRQLLHTLIHVFRKRPVGLETLAAALGEDIATVQDVMEPYLLQTGMIVCTPRGREATEKAEEHLLLQKNNRSGA